MATPSRIDPPVINGSVSRLWHSVKMLCWFVNLFLEGKVRFIAGDNPGVLVTEGNITFVVPKGGSGNILTVILPIQGQMYEVDLLISGAPRPVTSPFTPPSP